MGTPAVIRSLRQARESQAGVAASVLLALAGLLIVLLVLGLAGSLSRQQEADRQTGEALAQAKVALLGYATTYLERQGTGGDQFGYLPCPDTVVSAIPEGNEESGCGKRDITAIGRLPWKSLGLPALKDSASECLWYVVSGNFKANKLNNTTTEVTKSKLLNWDSNALIEVFAPDGATRLAGSTPTNRAAAVVFGPGAVLPGQDRTSLAGTPTCGGNYTASNYLDTDPNSSINNAAPSAIANALTSVIAALNPDQVADPNHNFNDRLIYITSEEIWREIGRRSDFIAKLTDADPGTGLLGFAAQCLAQQARDNSSRFPWAARVELPDYHPDDNYDSDVINKPLAGRLPKFPSSCAAPPNILSFWRNWKDHFFYVVAEPFNADSTFSSEPDPCLFGKCLTVDGEGPFAAVLIFAGERRDGQSRNTNANYSSTDKGNLANYLEGENLLALQASAPSDPNWGIFMRTAGNDIVLPICADAALNVYPNCDFATTPPQSQCDSDGLLLLGYQDAVDPKTNNCKDPAGKGKHVSYQECQDIRDRIKSNCDKECGKAAEDFLKKPCIDNLEDKKCEKVIEDLGSCEAK